MKHKNSLDCRVSREKSSWDAMLDLRSGPLMCGDLERVWDNENCVQTMPWRILIRQRTWRSTLCHFLPYVTDRVSLRAHPCTSWWSLDSSWRWCRWCLGDDECFSSSPWWWWRWLNRDDDWLSCPWCVSCNGWIWTSLRSPRRNDAMDDDRDVDALDVLCKDDDWETNDATWHEQSLLRSSSSSLWLKANRERRKSWGN